MTEMSTFLSRSTQSSASSRKYHLDENDTSPIMVYKVRRGTSISTQKDLCHELDRGTHAAGESHVAQDAPANIDPDLLDTQYRCSRKTIPRGTSRLDISQKDLYTDQERKDYSGYINYNAPIASVGLPLKVRMRRMLFGHFQDLYIVSPEGSPSSSPEGSEQNSQNVSPSNTWNATEEEPR